MPNEVIPSILGVAGLAVGALAFFTRGAASPAKGEAVLSYGPRARTAASAALALPFFAAALAAHRVSWSEEPARFWLLVASAALALLFLWLVRVEVTGVRHRITSEALIGGSSFSKPVRIPWSEIRAVRFSQLNQWFEIEGNSGVRVHISLFLDGLPLLAYALKERGILSCDLVGVSALARLTGYGQESMTPEPPRSRADGGRS